MNTKILKLPEIPKWPHITLPVLKKITPVILMAGLLLLWFVGPIWIHQQDATAGYVDQNIWLMIALSVFCFMLIASLCWWLQQRFWMALGLPSINKMVLQFNTLTLWQQLSFYWLSFFSLLLTALSCLRVIC